MSPISEYFPNEGVEALTILTKGTGGGKSAIARIEILEDRDREQRLNYAEYRIQTRETISKLENELDNRMKTFQIEMSEELKDLRRDYAEKNDERHSEMKKYMQAIIGMLVVAVATMIWKFVTK